MLPFDLFKIWGLGWHVEVVKESNLGHQNTTVSRQPPTAEHLHFDLQFFSIFNFVGFEGNNVLCLFRKPRSASICILLVKRFTTFSHSQKFSIECHLRCFSTMTIKPLSIWISWIVLEVTKKFFKTLPTRNKILKFLQKT